MKKKRFKISKSFLKELFHNGKDYPPHTFLNKNYAIVAYFPKFKNPKSLKRLSKR